MALRIGWYSGIALAMALAPGLQPASPAWARSGQAPAATLSAAVESAPAQPAPAAGGGATLITLSADNTPVVEILKILASRTGLNIATGSEVEKHLISLHIRETPFEEALNLVCRTAGLGYERVGNSILVADAKSLDNQTGLASRVFDLHYANAIDVAKVLEVIAPGVKVDARSNRVVVRAPQSVLEQVAQAIVDLDRKPLQVMLEARLIEVNTTRLSEMGIDWEKITKWTGVFAEGSQTPSAAGSLPTQLGNIKVTDGDTWYRQNLAFEVALDALITDGSAKLLANSRVVTLDGQPAEIFAGETVPVVITSLQSPGSGGGVLQTVQLEKIDVGVRLNITPRIGEDQLITTLVEPEVSRIIAFVGPDNDLPETSTRRAKTLVRVKAGQKIYLGGLLTEEKTTTVKSVPILGQLPLLGPLFRHHRDETTRLDLVIEITPRIIGDEGGDTAVGGQPRLDAEAAWRAIEQQRQSARDGVRQPAH